MVVGDPRLPLRSVAKKCAACGCADGAESWDLDEECHIEGETEFEAAVAESVVMRGTDIAIGQVFLHISACLVPACVCLEAC